MGNKIGILMLLFLFVIKATEESNQNNECICNALSAKKDYVAKILSQLKYIPPTDTSLKKAITANTIPHLNEKEAFHAVNLVFGAGMRVPITSTGIKPQAGHKIDYVQTPRVEDETAYEFIVDVLLCKQPKVQKFLYLGLAERSRRDFLIKYGNKIKKSMIDYIRSKAPAAKQGEKNTEPDPETLYGAFGDLYALLPLADTEKSQLLKTKELGLSARANLGDTSAETELIEKYQRADTFMMKSRCAHALGIAGTERCAKALIESLGSALMDTTWQDDRRTQVCHIESIKLPILLALTEIKPDAPFRYDIYFINTNGEDAYGGPVEKKQLIDRILIWSKNQYHTVPKNTMTCFFNVKVGTCIRISASPLPPKSK